jgi:flavin-dependent dehydrogenase
MKIVIVGGGTAGWLAAMYCARFNHSTNTPNEIVVIESSKIPIIGAGEGSTGTLRKVVDHYFSHWGMTETDFLNNTEATLKLGINLKDWNGIGTQFYSPIDPTATHMGSLDSDLLIAHVFGNYSDASPSGYLMGKGYSTYSNNKKDNTGGHSYHFDANKVGKYFKGYASKYGVKCIDTEITKLNRNSINGELDSVETTIGKIDADFWIDCTGFARALIKPMGGDWVSYKDYLPVNGAIPYIHEYQKDEDIRMETLSWAMPNGWMWQIPTQKRYGCGYVYSDMFTTYDNAVDEMRKVTGRKIEPLRDLKFDIGRTKNIWVKNVVAVGLSAGFVEPLEATSIHATIIQLDTLLSTALNFVGKKEDIIYDANINLYNKIIAKVFDDIKDLIQIHYMTDREDTEFWKYCKYGLKRTDKVKEILEMCKHRSPSTMDFDMYHGTANWGVWCWTLMGLGHISKEVAQNTLNCYKHPYNNIQTKFKEINHRNTLNKIKCMSSSEFMKALLNKEIGK